MRLAEQPMCMCSLQTTALLLSNLEAKTQTALPPDSEEVVGWGREKKKESWRIRFLQDAVEFKEHVGQRVLPSSRLDRERTSCKRFVWMFVSQFTQSENNKSYRREGTRDKTQPPNLIQSEKKRIVRTSSHWKLKAGSGVWRYLPSVCRGWSTYWDLT